MVPKVNEEKLDAVLERVNQMLKPQSEGGYCPFDHLKLEIKTESIQKSVLIRLQVMLKNEEIKFEHLSGGEQKKLVISSMLFLSGFCQKKNQAVFDGLKFSTEKNAYSRLAGKTKNKVGYSPVLREADLALSKEKNVVIDSFIAKFLFCLPLRIVLIHLNLSADNSHSPKDYYSHTELLSRRLVPLVLFEPFLKTADTIQKVLHFLFYLG